MEQGCVGTVLYRRGSVYSADDPYATAMLVESGRIAWIGGEDAASSLGGGEVRVVDLEGSLVTPGFVDAHLHLTEVALARSSIDLRGARSARDVLDRVAGSSGALVLGHGWDETTWNDPTLPSEPELLRAANGRSVYLTRIDVHSALVAGELRGAYPDGADGAATPDGDGRPGAFVTRDAHSAVRRAVDSGLSSQRDRLHREALAHCASVGIVEVHENGAPQVASQLDLVELLDLGSSAEGLHLPRIRGMYGALAADAEEAAQLIAPFERFRPGAVDGEAASFLGLAGDLDVDGSIGSHTAALHADYADAPGERGNLYLDAERIAAHVIACIDVGVATGFHVIGDSAVAAALTGYEAARSARPDTFARSLHRIEHLEMLSSADLSRWRDLGVIASVQPSFDRLWGHAGELYEQRLGAARAATLNPFAAMLATGIPLAFGSDAPVTPVAPWEWVRAAITHSRADQAISGRAAFLAATRGGLRAGGARETGALRIGAPATFVRWEAGPLIVHGQDERIQTWSTDPRARTPLLPDLAPDTDAPRCLGTVRAARILHESASGLL